MKDFAFEDRMESHFAANNRIAKEGLITLDTLDYYAGPWGAIISAVNMAAVDGITMEEAHAEIDRAISDYKALNAALDLAEAA
jgi:hypothetical protein